MISLIQNFDNFILLFIKNNMHIPIIDKIMVAFTSLGDNGVIWIVIATILLINKKSRKVGAIVIIALIIGNILGEEVIKNIVQRIRPSANIPSTNMLIVKPLTYSFPSGHTTTSFAAAGVLAKYFKKYAFGFFGLASLIAFSRLYLYVHYPSDVFAGIILGLISTAISISLVNKISSYNGFLRDKHINDAK